MKALYIVILIFINTALIFEFNSLRVEVSKYLDSLNPVFVGLMLYFTSYVIFLKKSKNYHLITTLSHEINHMTTCLLFNQTIHDIYASNGSGGHLKFNGKRGKVFIFLAPYFLPLGFLFCLIFIGFIDSQFIALFRIFLGVILGFYLITFLEQTKPYQTDLQVIGIKYSYVFISLMNVLFLSISTYVICFGWSNLPSGICQGSLLLTDNLTNLWFELRNVVLAVL